MDDYSTVANRKMGLQYPGMPQQFDFAIDSRIRTAEITINLSSQPYLADHGLLDMMVLPGSFYIDVALYIDRQLSNRVASVIRNAVFQYPVILSTTSTGVKVEVIEHNNNRVEYKFYEA